MATELEKLKHAFLAADAAGDTESAGVLAKALKRAMLVQANPAEYDPASPEFQEQYGPTSGMTGGQKFRAGAGKAFYDIGRGAKQLTGNLSRADVDARRAMDAPLMDTGAGITGNIAGGLATSAPLALIPGINTYAGATLAGGALGALQPVGVNDSRAFNTAAGAGGGALGKAVGDRLIGLASRRPASQAAGAGSRAQAGAQVGSGQAGAQTVVSAAPQVRATGGGYTFGHVGDDAAAGLNAPTREVMERGLARGMRTTPGQATGSRALQQMEAKLESQPMTSGPFNTIKANNARVLNREAAQAIGETSDTLDSAVLDRAFTRIGGVFDDAGDDVARQIDPQSFLQTFTQIQDDIRGLVSGFGDHPLVADLTRFAQGGHATGRQLQSLTSKLGKAAYKNMTTQSGDRDLGMALYQVKDYVDDLLQQGMDDARAATFQQARQQYRNLMLLTSRVGIVNPSTGNVSGRSLANILQSKDKRGYLRGQNQSGMYDAARFAQAFAPIVGDSGTATRMPLQGLTDMVARIPLNIASRAYTSSPSVNLAVGAQAAAGAASRAAAPVLRPVINPLRPYLPRYLPTYGGLLGADLASQ